jgi:hypothetical protein
MGYNSMIRCLITCCFLIFYSIVVGQKAQTYNSSFTGIFGSDYQELKLHKNGSFKLTDLSSSCIGGFGTIDTGRYKLRKDTLLLYITRSKNVRKDDEDKLSCCESDLFQAFLLVNRKLHIIWPSHEPAEDYFPVNWSEKWAYAKVEKDELFSFSKGKIKGFAKIFDYYDREYYIDGPERWMAWCYFHHLTIFTMQTTTPFTRFPYL